MIGTRIVTVGDIAMLHDLTEYRPGTEIAAGIDAFVRWYREDYAPAKDCTGA